MGPKPPRRRWRGRLCRARMSGMEVQDDTVIITISSRLAKTGKSTIARIIAEALGRYGLSTGVEDDTPPRIGQSKTESFTLHCDRIGTLIEREQSILIKVMAPPPPAAHPRGDGHEEPRR